MDEVMFTNNISVSATARVILTVCPSVQALNLFFMKHTHHMQLLWFFSHKEVNLTFMKHWWNELMCLSLEIITIHPLARDRTQTSCFNGPTGQGHDHRRGKNHISDNKLGTVYYPYIWPCHMVLMTLDVGLMYAWLCKYFGQEFEFCLKVKIASWLDVF